MTDKEQIMINGVDVSKCEYLTYELEEDGEYYWFCSIAPAGGPDECEYNPECFCKKIFKQLQRKTQECEQKEKELLSNEKIINKLMKEVDELKQECEKLKNQVDEDYNYYTTELKTLRDIISNKEKRNAALFLMSNRYRKALEEIEDEYFKGLDTKQIAELAKKSIRLTTENRKLENKLSDIAGICEQILDGEDYVRRIAKTILDIID